MNWTLIWQWLVAWILVVGCATVCLFWCTFQVERTYNDRAVVQFVRLMAGAWTVLFCLMTMLTIMAFDYAERGVRDEVPALHSVLRDR